MSASFKISFFLKFSTFCKIFKLSTFFTFSTFSKCQLFSKFQLFSIFVSQIQTRAGQDRADLFPRAVHSTPPLGNFLIRETIKEYSIEGYDNVEVDDSILNTCEIQIFPILLIDLILAKVRGYSISYAASRRKKQLYVVSGLLLEIKDLEWTINSAETPMPEVVERIKYLKDSLVTEVENEDMEKAKIAFAKKV